MSYTTPDPKPAKRARKPRKAISRTRIKRKPPRRLDGPGSDPVRNSKVRQLPCVGIRCFPGHVCLGRMEVSHERNHTGLGLKSNDSTGIPKCTLLHQQWERRLAPFRRWSNLGRLLWHRERQIETNAALEVFWEVTA